MKLKVYFLNDILFQAQSPGPESGLHEGGGRPGLSEEPHRHADILWTGKTRALL